MNAFEEEGCSHVVDDQKIEIFWSFSLNFFFLFSLFSWGLPLLMLSVAAAFIYKERDAKITSTKSNHSAVDVNTSDIHCW
jgi:hypothetical protein